MAMRRAPDREMLRRLLDSGKLAQEERAEAQRLLDDLSSGRVLRLPMTQRVWVERLFYRFRLGDQRPKQVTKDSKTKTKDLLAAFDAMPRPKKPPGKG